MPNKQNDENEKVKKPLDPKKLDKYKKLLLELRNRYEGDIKMINSETQDNADSQATGHALHMADVATDMYDKEFNSNLASHDRETLVRINSALKRIEDGTYGYCLKSGKLIKPARLTAIPYAEYSLEVQEEMDVIDQHRKK